MISAHLNPVLKASRQKRDTNLLTVLRRFLACQEKWEPVKGDGGSEATFPNVIILSCLGSNVPFHGSNNYMEGGWIYNMPEPNPGVFEMVHRKYDELVMLIGSDPDDPEYLGAEIEFELGGKQYTVNSTSSVWLPGGVKMGPIKWKNFRYPHIELSITFNCGDRKKIYGDMK
jgi:hypothetical protein